MEVGADVIGRAVPGRAGGHSGQRVPERGEGGQGAALGRGRPGRSVRDGVAGTVRGELREAALQAPLQPPEALAGVGTAGERGGPPGADGLPSAPGDHPGEVREVGPVGGRVARGVAREPRRVPAPRHTEGRPGRRGLDRRFNVG